MAQPSVNITVIPGRMAQMLSERSKVLEGLEKRDHTFRWLFPEEAASEQVLEGRVGM